MDQFRNSNEITVDLEDAKEFVEWAKTRSFCNSGQHICDRLADLFENKLAEILMEE